MKKQFLFVAFIATVALFFSCKKSNPAVPTVTPAEGSWVGNYSSGGGSQTFYYAFQFNAGGAVVVKANDAILPSVANGTWTIAADSIRSTYTYNPGGTFSMIGKYDGKSNTIVGTWGSGTDNKGGGTFTIVKQ